MTPKHRTRLLVEALEDRLTPASYFYDGSNLTIIGTTNLPTFTLTETANNTLMTPAGTFSVTGNLTVRLTEFPTNPLTINYTLGAFTANGAVSLSATSLGASTAVNVTGTTATIGGPLSVSVTNINTDTVTVNGLTVGGIRVTDVIGNGTVNIANTANVTDNGNLFIVHANTVTIDAIGGAATATIQGLASVSTRALPAVTNAVTFGSNSSVGGPLIFSGAGNNNVALGGTVGGAVVALLGNGANTLTFANTSAILGNVTVVGGNGGNSVTAAAGSTFLGNLSMIMGNSPNTVDFAGTTFGTVAYFGGNGGDSFTFDTGATANSLFLLFGAGNDTFTLNSGNVLSSIYANGGFGTNTFVGNATPPAGTRVTLINF